jgi:transcriptional regulator with XRE-family HTH domain
MEDGVGRTLREARTRRKIDLAEVESATKIRARYLRAIENEEWDLLPGETYARAFIRAYAEHLGLDGERLAEEQRRDRGAVRPGERLARIEQAAGPRRPRSRRRAPIPPRALAAVVSVALIALLIIVGLSSGGGSSTPTGVGNSKHHRGQGGSGVESPGAETPQTPVSGHIVRLTATAEVWVCLLNASGAPLIDGQILAAGASEGPYRSGSFTLSLGNGEVTMTVDGEQASIPETSSPVGYSIGSGELRQLSEGERPTCT